MKRRASKSRLAPLGGAFLSCLLFFAGLAAFLIYYPGTPLPPEWNPTKPLSISDPVTPLTSLKFANSLADPDACLAALGTHANFEPLPDLEVSPQCYIRGQVLLQGAAGVKLQPVNTRCQTALRTAMWVEHGISPAARQLLQQQVSELVHLSSYNCRPVRTGRSGETRMSTHATAEAIDVTGVRLANGRQLTLLADWNSEDASVKAFMRAMRDSACTWFRTTLGPEYNNLHRDHFHLQHTGWGTCR